MPAGAPRVPRLSHDAAARRSARLRRAVSHFNDKAAVRRLFVGNENIDDTPITEGDREPYSFQVSVSRNDLRYSAIVYTKHTGTFPDTVGLTACHRAAPAVNLESDCTAFLAWAYPGNTVQGTITGAKAMAYGITDTPTSNTKLVGLTAYAFALSAPGGAYPIIIGLEAKAQKASAPAVTLAVGADCYTVGAVTTSYAVRCQANTSAGTDFGIYSECSRNYFAGAVGLGKTSPMAKLHVVGDTIVELGALYVDNAGLRIWDPTSTGRMAVKLNSNYTADHTLAIVTGDQDRTLDFTNGTLDPFKVVSVSSDYSAATDDHVILVNAAAGAVTITTPAAADAVNPLTVKKIDSSSYKVTIDGNGAETIDGEATLDLLLEHAAVTIASDGTNWHVVGRA